MIAGAVSMTHRTNYVLIQEWFAYEQMGFSSFFAVFLVKVQQNWKLLGTRGGGRS